MWRFIRIAPNNLLLLLPLPRHGITYSSSGRRFYSSKTLDPAQRITDLLTHNNNWLSLLESSDIPNDLDADVVRSVISHNCVSKPKKLVSFFLWSQYKAGNQNLKDLNLFSFLVVSLCNSGSLMDARGIIETMIRDWNAPLGVTNSVVSSFREARSSGSTNPVVFEMLISAYRKAGKPVEASNVFLGLADVGEFRPGPVSCNMLLRDLLRANRFELLFKVYDRMSEMGVEFDVYAYTSIISAHFKREDVVSAKRVFSEMAEKGCSPDFMTYNFMIGGLCNAGLVDEAVEMKASMVEKGFAPDRYTYTYLIMGYFRGNRPDKAFEVKDEMVARGIPVDSHTYRTLLYGVCKAGGEMGKAREIVDEMVNSGLKPDLKVYTLMIEGFSRDFNMVGAFATFDEMKLAGLKPSVVTYNVLVKGLCGVGNFEGANSLVEEMTSLGLEPDRILYNTMISAYLREGKPEEAKKTLGTMKERGIEPNEITYNSLVFGFCSILDFESARAFFDEMSAKKIQATERTYRAFVHGYIKAGNSEMADRYLEKIPEPRSYAVLINCLSSNGKIEEALRVLSELREKKGFVPDIYHYNPIIVGLCKRGDLEEAFRLHEEMSMKGIKTDIGTSNALIRGFCEADEVEKGVNFLRGFSEKGLTPNRDSYSMLIECYERSGNTGEAAKLRDEMTQKGFLTT